MNPKVPRKEIYYFLSKSLSAHLRDANYSSLEGMHLIDDLGLDSLDVVSLLFDIEDHYGVVIPEVEISPHQLLQIDNLVAFIESGATE